MMNFVGFFAGFSVAIFYVVFLWRLLKVKQSWQIKLAGFLVVRWKLVL